MLPERLAPYLSADLSALAAAVANQRRRRHDLTIATVGNVGSAPTLQRFMNERRRKRPGWRQRRRARRQRARLAYAQPAGAAAAGVNSRARSASAACDARAAARPQASASPGAFADLPPQLRVDQRGLAARRTAASGARRTLMRSISLQYGTSVASICGNSARALAISSWCSERRRSTMEKNGSSSRSLQPSRGDELLQLAQHAQRQRRRHQRHDHDVRGAQHVLRQQRDARPGNPGTARRRSRAASGSSSAAARSDGAARPGARRSCGRRSPPAAGRAPDSRSRGSAPAARACPRAASSPRRARAARRAARRSPRPASRDPTTACAAAGRGAQVGEVDRGGRLADAALDVGDRVDAHAREHTPRRARGTPGRALESAGRFAGRHACACVTSTPEWPSSSASGGDQRGANDQFHDVQSLRSVSGRAVYAPDTTA